MADTSNTAEVNILDKDYLVACPNDESRGELYESARYLDSKMREIRSSGKVFGTERIAVMAALNITHELLHQNHLSSDASNLLAQLDRRLDEVLGDDSGQNAG
ncbi:cell division protein ZapA [Tamilnaduibacter salinus]|uniref:Cell division protein ZapA n=1 Tax=Tamilnaduibacter salinus TaxID=1484056 RepID=A0A2A2I233_9GAMM|nr:cell division protein ZapA [Tamilnaduibacter salinus]PAV25376.1 cell division protein ZapA [Tamilnaduibacter salinus]PVY76510.1 cell division protein ZapA [Tamilnaduibacter salinus]